MLSFKTIYLSFNFNFFSISFPFQWFPTGLLSLPLPCGWWYYALPVGFDGASHAHKLLYPTVGQQHAYSLPGQAITTSTRKTPRRKKKEKNQPLLNKESQYLLSLNLSRQLWIPATFNSTKRRCPTFKTTDGVQELRQAGRRPARHSHSHSCLISCYLSTS